MKTLKDYKAEAMQDPELADAYELEMRCRLLAVLDAIDFLRKRAEAAAAEYVHSDNDRHAAIIEKLNDVFVHEAENLWLRSDDISEKFGDEIRRQPFNETVKKFWKF